MGTAMGCHPHQPEWVRVHRQPGFAGEGTEQMPCWGKASPGSNTSARELSISAVVAAAGPHLGKASPDMRFCGANLWSKDKAHWLFSHGVT